MLGNNHHLLPYSSVRILNKMFEINIKLTTFKSTFFLKEKIINSGIYVQTPSGEPISKINFVITIEALPNKVFCVKSCGM